MAIKMGSVQTTEDLDEIIRKAAEDIDLWGVFSPTNEEEQKKRFLNEDLDNINLKYDLPDPKKLDRHRRNLEHASVPVWESPWVKDQYRGTLEYYLDQIKLVQNIGKDSSIVRNLTEKSFGKPIEEGDDFDVVEEARDMVRNGCGVENGYPGSGETYDPGEMVEKFEIVLENFGLLGDWNVDTTEKGGFRVSAPKREILVPKKREYDDKEAQHLLHHEIGGHTLRAANGYNQPYQILGVGTEGYMRIEEGITTTLEEMTGTLDPELMEKYASRVLAVQSVLNGDSFRDTFEMMREYGLDEDDSWDRTMRAHRGGGCIKDHVYLKGKMRVRQYLEEGGELKYLMIGKTDLEDQEDMKRLEENNTLVNPTYNPASLAEGEAEVRMKDAWEGNYRS